MQADVSAVHLEAEVRVVGPSRELAEEGIDLGGQMLQLEALRRRCSRGEEARRLRLERFAQLVEVTDISGGRNPDASTGAWTAFDEAIGLEAPERVGHRQDAHAELLRQATARQCRARAELTA